MTAENNAAPDSPETSAEAGSSSTAARSSSSDAGSTPAEAGSSSLRGRIRPLPAETADETFLPFLDLCFNWSMDKPRIELEDLRYRSDAVFYYRDWGRDGDIAVAAHAAADPVSPIIGLAWVRLADIDDVIGRIEERASGDFAAALAKTGAEVVRSEVVPAGEAEDPADEAVAAGPDDPTPSDEPADPTSSDDEPDNPAPADEVAVDKASAGEATHFTGYGWVAADIPELTVAVLPEHQGQGIGGALVDAVCALARMSGFPAVSLSVEDGNGAAKLYADHGFESVGRNGDSDVLVRRLG